MLITFERKMNRFRPLIYLPNLDIRLLPGGFVRDGLNRKLTFRCAKSITKPELKNYLTEVYGLSISKINTLNTRPESKRDRRTGKVYTSESSYKKAIVTLAAPAALKLPAPELKPSSAAPAALPGKK